MFIRFALMVLAATCFGSAHANDRLPTAVADALTRARIPLQSVSVVVQPIGSSKATLAFNTQTPMNPASVMKLVTTFAALELLEPAYQWRTEAYLGGPLNDGVLGGDLVIKGYGDPKLTLERLWLLTSELRARGIRDIRGDLVLDRSHFALSQHDSASFDNEPLRPYNVGPDTLLFNFKSLSVTFVPQPLVGSVSIFSTPGTTDVRIDNQVQLTSGPCDPNWRSGIALLAAEANETTLLKFTGRMAADCGERVWHVAVANNARFVLASFRKLWLESGGTFSGNVRDGLAPTDRPPFAVWLSPTAAEVVRDINKYSNNVMAQQVFLSLSSELLGPPGNFAASTRVVQDWAIQRRIEMPELVMENGSGLSRIERISAASLAKLLTVAYRSAVMPEFLASMPVVAQDGTMQKRLKSERVSGRAHIKTGALNDVRTIAGYVHHPSGRRVVIVFMINHPNAAAGRDAQDALLRWAHDMPLALSVDGQL